MYNFFVKVNSLILALYPTANLYCLSFDTLEKSEMKSIMNSMISDSRTKAILNFLANSNEIVTFKQIAEEIGVSRRTILREFPDAELWLKSNNFELQKKQGQGIVLKGDETCRSRLREILNENMPCIISVPKDRQKILLIELLQQNEPVKLYAFKEKEYDVPFGRITYI
jgi:transcriptional antiterminator